MNEDLRKIIKRDRDTLIQYIVELYDFANANYPVDLEHDILLDSIKDTIVSFYTFLKKYRIEERVDDIENNPFSTREKILLHLFSIMRIKMKPKFIETLKTLSDKKDDPRYKELYSKYFQTIKGIPAYEIFYALDSLDENEIIFWTLKNIEGLNNYEITKILNETPRNIDKLQDEINTKLKHIIEEIDVILPQEL